MGRIINELGQRYTSPVEEQILGKLRELNRMRIKVVHPGSEPSHSRIAPDHCPSEFSEAFYQGLEDVVEAIGGYSMRQFGADVVEWLDRGPPTDEQHNSGDA